MKPSVQSTPRSTCPLPLPASDKILLAHGGGGRLMNTLIDELFIPVLDPDGRHLRHDGAVLDVGGARVAFTTDGFVVQPLFFPGGDIGKLAVCGTVNDLAMCGAEPRFLSVAMILEEGVPMETVRRVVRSVQSTALQAGVQVVTGDTKVVERGKGDQMFLVTTGVGTVPEGRHVHPDRVRAGDAILISGDLGRHGIALMAQREGLEFETTLESDCAPLHGLVRALFDAGLDVHCLRDLTRGGLVSSLVEIARAAGVSCTVDEGRIPVCDAVAGACEMLGLDPLYVANEGRLVAFLPAAQAERALAVLHAWPEAAGAAIIGKVQANRPGAVVLRGGLGTERPLDLLSGEQLPRIC